MAVLLAPFSYRRQAPSKPFLHRSHMHGEFPFPAAGTDVCVAEGNQTWDLHPLDFIKWFPLLPCRFLHFHAYPSAIRRCLTVTFGFVMMSRILASAFSARSRQQITRSEGLQLR